MGDDDDLPLAALARQSKRNKKKRTRKSRSASPTKSRNSKSPSPKRKQQKPKRAILKAYGLGGEFVGDVRGIAEFVVEHRKDVPAKVGFVLLGSAAFPIFLNNQMQLDLLPAGEYTAQIVYSHPSQEQLDTFVGGSVPLAPSMGACGTSMAPRTEEARRVLSMTCARSNTYMRQTHMY